MEGLGRYLNEIGRVPLLTPAQEVHLGKAIRAWLDHPDPAPAALRRRGLRARSRMTEANLRLVVNVAKRFHRFRSTLELEDLIQAGSIGLLRAAEKFDPARGYKFSTFAYWWIRQGVTRYMERCGCVVSIPGVDAERLARMGPIAIRLRESLGREPTVDDLAAELGIDRDRFERLAQLRNRVGSLDARVGDGATPLVELLPDEREAEIDEGRELVERLLGRLEPLERRVLIGTWGLEGKPVPTATMAAAEGISQSAVRTVATRAEERIRALAENVEPPPPARVKRRRSGGAATSRSGGAGPPSTPKSGGGRPAPPLVRSPRRPMTAIGRATQLSIF